MTGGRCRNNVRESSEDYLEAILVIRRLRGSCRNVDIAEHTGVTKPSVTKALGNLARKGLVEVVDHDVRLTATGERLAEETLSKHRFFEGALLDAGVDAEVASKEACRMEHCIYGFFREPLLLPGADRGFSSMRDRHRQTTGLIVFGNAGNSAKPSRPRELAETTPPGSPPGTSVILEFRFSG